MKIQHWFFLILLFTSFAARAQDLESPWHLKNLEAHAVYLRQNSGGETQSLVPYWVPRYELNEKYALGLRLGYATYQDQSAGAYGAIETDLHADLSWGPASDWSWEPLIAYHFWDRGGSFAGIGMNFKYSPEPFPICALIGFQYWQSHHHDTAQIALGVGYEF